MNNQNPNTKDSDSIDILRIFSQRKGFIFLSLILALAGAYIATTAFITPKYQAIVKVLVKQEKLDVSNVLPIYEYGDTFIKSQAQVISSKPIIKSALEDIEDSSVYSEEINPVFLNVTSLQKNMVVEVLRGTNVLELKVENEDRELIAPFTNAIAQAYIDYYTQSKVKIVKEALANLDKQVEFANKQLEKEEQSLEKYLLKEGIGVMPESEIGIDFRRFASFDLEVVKAAAELESVNVQLMEFDKAIKTSQSKELILPFLVNNPVLKDLNDKIRSAEIARVGILVNYTLDHPDVVSVQLAIQELKNDFKGEQRRIVIAERESIKMEKSRLKSKMEVLSKEKDMQSKELQNLLKKQPELSSFLSRVKAKRSIFEDLLTQQSELKMFEERIQTVSDIVVIEPAEAPTSPVSPNLFINLFLGGLCGLTIGSIVAIMLAASKRKGIPSAQGKYEQTIERRSSPRSNAANMVTCTVVGERNKVVCWSKNVGRSGMKIITKKKLQRNNILEFAIRRDKMKPIVGNGVVVWTAPVSANDSNIEYAAGVKFYDLELDIKKK